MKMGKIKMKKWLAVEIILAVAIVLVLVNLWLNIENEIIINDQIQVPGDGTGTGTGVGPGDSGEGEGESEGEGEVESGPEGVDGGAVGGAGGGGESEGEGEATTYPEAYYDYQAGWPQEISESGGLWIGALNPVTADLDNDGKKEIVVFVQKNPPQEIRVYRHDGELKYPAIKLPLVCPYSTTSTHGSVSIADIDGDTFQEIIIPCNGEIKEILVYGHDGTLENEFEAMWANDNFYGGLNINDIDGNGEMEIIYGGWDNEKDSWLNVVGSDGNQLSGFPVNLYSGSQNSEINKPCAGNFDDDPEKEIAVLMHRGNFTNNYVWIFDTDGSVLVEKVFDIINYMDPSCGDVNNDGYDEIVFASEEGLHIVDRTGELILNKVIGSGLMHSNTVIFDAEGDGNMEIVFGYGGKIYLVSSTGSVMMQHTIPSGDAWRSIIIGDLDGSGGQDIIQAGESGVYGIDLNGIVLSGFPLPTSANSIGAVLMDDIDNDGDIELVAGVSDFSNEPINTGYVYVWDLPYSAGTILWEMLHKNKEHTSHP